MGDLISKTFSMSWEFFLHERGSNQVHFSTESSFQSCCNVNEGVVSTVAKFLSCSSLSCRPVCWHRLPLTNNNTSWASFHVRIDENSVLFVVSKRRKKIVERRGKDGFMTSTKLRFVRLKFPAHSYTLFFLLFLFLYFCLLKVHTTTKHDEDAMTKK